MGIHAYILFVLWKVKGKKGSSLFWVQSFKQIRNSYQIFLAPSAFSCVLKTWSNVWVWVWQQSGSLVLWTGTWEDRKPASISSTDCLHALLIYSQWERKSNVEKGAMAECVLKVCWRLPHTHQSPSLSLCISVFAKLYGSVEPNFKKNLDVPWFSVSCI